ncbi:MAG: hypothetical protein NVS9B9_24430 [Ktedonobacteraceae bacterium]
MEYDPMIGTRLGDYLIQSTLGEGGMARVYKAHHIRLRRDVAIKVISSQAVPDFQTRFEREAQVIANLEHPNIVKVFDFREVEGGEMTYLVMQYVGGGTLHSQMHEGHPLPPQRAAHYALQMAHALHHAHQRGIVHRDVKPQNMLIASTDPNQLLLSDFGIAKVFGERQEAARLVSTPGMQSSNPMLTHVDQIVGTAAYMAPEQIQRQAVDARTDVYALGVVLFHMLTGHTPFHSTTLIGLMYQHVQTPPPPIRSINPNVPEPLAYIVAKALEKSPSARFQSAEAMAQALEIALSTITMRTNAIGHSSGEAYIVRNNYNTPTYQPLPTPSTASSNANVALTPAAYHRPRSNTFTGVRIATGSLLVLLLATFVFFRVFPPGGRGSGIGTPTAQKAVAFTDTFTNNNQQWTGSSDSNGLTTRLGMGNYALAVSNNATYFPSPTAIGTLPDKFTLISSMKQEKGSQAVVYGIAFHITYDGDQLQSGYAFVITSEGDYSLLRYDNGSAQPHYLATIHQSPLIHSRAINTLRVVVTGTTFSFFINDISATIKTSNSLTDSTYTGGKMGLLVAGPNAVFSVTKVQLTLQ